MAQCLVPLRTAPRLAPLITAIGVSFILVNVGLVWKGASQVNFPDLLPRVDIFRDVLHINTLILFTLKDLFVIVLAIPLMIGLTLFVQRTRLGKAMRADGVQALNALSSSVQGYMQGRKEESTKKFEEFKAKMQKVTTENKQKIEEYRGILDRRDWENQQKLTMLQITSQKYDDAAMYYATECQDYAFYPGAGSPEARMKTA